MIAITYDESKFEPGNINIHTVARGQHNTSVVSHQVGAVNLLIGQMHIVQMLEVFHTFLQGLQGDCLIKLW